MAAEKAYIINNYKFSWVHANRYREQGKLVDFDKYADIEDEGDINSAFDREVISLMGAENELKEVNDKECFIGECKRLVAVYTKAGVAPIFKDDVAATLVDDEKARRLSVELSTQHWYDCFHPRVVVFAKLMKILFIRLGCRKFEYEAGAKGASGGYIRMNLTYPIMKVKTKAKS